MLCYATVTVFIPVICSYYILGQSNIITSNSYNQPSYLYIYITSGLKVTIRANRNKCLYFQGKPH